jgi:inner membrane transporter RhtA
MISIQAGGALAKKLFVLTQASGAAALRVGLAAIFTLAVVRPWRHRLSRAEWARVARFGVALGGMNLIFYWAIARIPLGTAVALEFAGPLAVAFWYSRRKLDFLWALLATGGILLLFPIRLEAGVSLDPLGVFFALLAGAFWGAYIVFGHAVGKTVPAPVALAWGLGFASLAVVPFGLMDLARATPSPRLLGLALSVALFTSAVPFWLEMIALKRLPQKTFAIFMSLEPALAGLSGWLFLGEVLSPVQTFAISCVMVAALGSATTGGPAEASLPEGSSS